MFLCITPIPPSFATAIAILLSVTVSIAELKKGIFKYIFLVNLVFKLTSLGNIDDFLGIKETSSKVKASFTILSINYFSLIH
ncbi:hypothetical protein Q7M_1367 (plasmid) [Borrelia crocidurae str. Achema]|uniref:Variable large protein n=1 Tax=Borrelia crocidurae (strain Achema) TaxID=1155096 RepID=I0FF67_BORCA|nr:hypothetical protein Q7M_1367 [Borrelia crocidurae str. Achema]